MFNTSTNVHFDSLMSVRLPIVDSVCVWGDLTKPAITIEGDFTEIWHFVLQLDVALLLQNFVNI